MSEEKLRALLAEAREWVDAARFLPQKPEVGWEEKENLLARIDAALAEPVEGPLNAVSRLSQQMHEARSNAEWLVQQAQRERDEARAEVRRTYKELSESIAREAEAYERGAEAMREAAASCVGSDTALLQTYRSVLKGRIRDLPMPEDKP